MPTKRTKRTRNLRREPGGAVEAYVHGRMTVDELNQAYDNPFIEFVVTMRDNPLGQQAYEIWLQDGERLLAEAGYRGLVKVPDYNIVHYGDLPENLVTMVSAYGEPWK